MSVNSNTIEVIRSHFASRPARLDFSTSAPICSAM
ncbi:Uncharacterised protein [Vibrio cholerae]|nr:Uncharacterised protein [Vibrio cholerae]